MATIQQFEDQVIQDRGKFVIELLEFINVTLPAFDRNGTKPAKDERQSVADRRTSLFESGLIDSLSILHIIAFVELKTQRRIPREMILMKHFHSVEAIADAFVPKSFENNSTRKKKT